MEKWIVFSGVNCPWCDRAKDLLESKDIEFEEVKVDSREKLAFMQQYAPNMRTVPVIIHNGVVIGGFNDLVKYLGTM